MENLEAQENQNKQGQQEQRKQGSGAGVAKLPPVMALFSDAWEVFTASLLRLFLLDLVNFVVLAGFGILGILVFLGLGLGRNFFEAFKISGPAAFAAVPANTYIIAGLVLLVLFLGYLVFGIALKTASIIVVSGYNRQEGVSSAIKRGFSFVIPLFLLGFVVFVVEFGGIFVFFFPALLFAFLFMLSAYEVVLNKQSFYNGLRRSLLIVSKRFWEVLARVFVYALLSLSAAFLIPGILRNIAPDAAPLIGILSFFVNTLLGWYGLCYFVTLYKQARVGFEGKEGANMRWVWIVAVLGWIVAVVLLIVGIGVLVGKQRESEYFNVSPPTSIPTMPDFVR